MLNPTPMTFKPNPPQASCPALPDWGLLRLQGRDAAAFLQAQAMNDVAALAPGHWHWSGLLTPKGRVLALFALLREADDAFLLAAPDWPGDALAAHLRRFVFRSKLSLEVPAGWQAAAGPALDAPAPGQALGDAAGGWALDLRGPGVPRGLWLLPAGHPALAPADDAATLAWREADLAQGLPRLAPAQREQFTPQMLSLERLRAFSLKKGCYPGQEIVARTHYLGQAKRALARFEAGAPVPAGAAVVDAEGRERGIVAASAGRAVLAVLPPEAAAEALCAGGQALQPRAFEDGLAR